jgi:uncharacterized GH25 family protein
VSKFHATLLIGALAGPALAHETWVLPSKFRAAPGEEVRFDVTSGMAFPALESPIRADRVAGAAYVASQTRSAIHDFETSDTSLFVRRAFPQAGIVTMSLELKPREIELTDDKVAHYLDEIGATAELRALWAAQKGRVPWRETYTKHMKTFVLVGMGLMETSWSRPVGSAFEIVPVTDPFAAVPGRPFTAELRANAKPAPDQPIGLIIGGSSERAFATTDSSGRATFSPTRAGRAMLYTVSLRPAGDGESWLSDFATMTFEILEGP